MRCLLPASLSLHTAVSNTQNRANAAHVHILPTP